MSLTYQQAMQYVSKCTGVHKKKYRNYAVSDFWNYRSLVQELATPAEYRKTWALYSKWVDLCTANPGQYASANGRSFASGVKFRYQKTGDEAPKAVSGPKTTDLEEVQLGGVGQCEFFAMQAFQALKAGGKAGTVPRVDKVSTPGHNWVLVNYTGGSSKNWVAVDYWLFAMGVAPARCICKYDVFKFAKVELERIDTFNPDNQD